MRPTAKSLESFRAIMRTGSVTDAAKQIGITQSAVSRQLAQLETNFGMKLFHRKNGRLTPVPEATELCQEVDLALTSLDRIEMLVDDLKNLSAGQLRVVGPPSFIEGVFAGAVASFLEKHPRTHFIVDSRSHESIIEMVLCRAVDCGFIKMPISNPDLSVQPVIRAGTCCALRMDHPLANKVSLTPKDLKGVPLVLHGKGRAFRMQVREAFHQAGVTMNVRAETHAIGASCALAAQGVGVAIVNSMMAKTYEGFGLTLVPFSPEIVHEYACVNSSQMPMSRIANAFLEHVCGYFKSISE